ncbi:MAG: hypothetical protein ACQKBT_01705, partial [Puniceicoccales bacterium]
MKFSNLPLLRLVLVAFFAVLGVETVRAEAVEVRVCPYYEDKEAALCLTFDDGLLDHATVVQPMLKESG